MKRIFVSDEPNTFHYLTFVTNRRFPAFTDATACEILADVISEIRDLHPFKLVGYVFMPDHIHLLINPLKDKLSIIQRKLKGKSARLILDNLINSGQRMALKRLELDLQDRIYALWQRRAASVDIVSPRFLMQKLRYIHLNPVRAGLCDDPKDWKWSSYMGYLPGCKEDVPLKIDWPSHWTRKEIEASRDQTRGFV